MSLELVPLCTLTVSLAETINVSSSLVIGEVTAARAEGERFQANLKGNAAADWLRVSPDGFGTLDVKITLETDDGAAGCDFANKLSQGCARPRPLPQLRQTFLVNIDDQHLALLTLRLGELLVEVRHLHLGGRQQLRATLLTCV